jgi:hypothetical protein
MPDKMNLNRVAIRGQDPLVRIENLWPRAPICDSVVLEEIKAMRGQDHRQLTPMTVCAIGRCGCCPVAGRGERKPACVDDPEVDGGELILASTQGH